MIVAIVIVLLIWLLWILGPYIRRWAMRRTANYVQDSIYRSMGIDPKQMRRESAQNQREYTRSHTRTRSQARHSYAGAKIIPREYGESVSFQILEITGDEKWLQDTDKSPVFFTYRNEKQIDDAKYTII